MEFFKKTAGYIGSGTLDYIKEAMPVSSSTISEAKSTASELKSSISGIGKSVIPTIRELKVKGGFKGITNWFLEKEDEFDDFDDSNVGLEFDDGSSISDAELAEIQIDKEDRNANKISKAVVESSHKMVEAQIASIANVNASLDKQTAVISAGFDKTNETLNKILEVMTKNTATLIETTEAMGRAQLTASEKMVRSGRFDMSEYAKGVKKNIADSDVGTFASIAFSMLQSPDTIKDFLKPSSLISMGIAGGLNKAAPNLKKNMQALDKAVNDTIMSSLIRLGEKNNWDKGGSILKLFGLDSTRKKISTSRSDLQVKSVSYNSLANEYITSAIPGYLRKILVAVGGDDVVYDARSRSFRSQNKIRKEYQKYVTSTGTLGSASSKVRSALDNNKFTNMAYDQMMLDIGSKTGKNNSHEVERIMQQLGSAKTAKEYLVSILGDSLTRKDTRALNKMAADLASLDKGWGIQDIKNQAARQTIRRNVSAKNYVENADLFGVDLSFIKDSVKADRQRIFKSYGRDDLNPSSSISTHRKVGSRTLSGDVYTNIALFEIYRRLNKGINVFQVGSNNERSTKYKGFSNLIPPGDYRIKPMTDDDRKRANSTRRRKIDPYSDDTNLLRNNTDADGNEEDLTKTQRISRWSKAKGGDFIHAMLTGNPDEVRDSFQSAVEDVSGIAKDGLKKGFSKINDDFGNVSGYLKHKMFGTEFEYTDEKGNKKKVSNVKGPNGEKGGLFGFFADEVKRSWNNANENKNKWWQEVSGYFNYDGDDKEEKSINDKRKKILGASIGAFAGAGILGGPLGILVGSIAGNALSTSKFGEKIKKKMFGRDEKGKATGFLTKAFDKITRPIEYQVKKTINWFTSGLKKHVFGPLSDIGYAVKNRVQSAVSKTLHKFILDPLGKAGKKIGGWVAKGVGKLGGMLYRGAAGAGGTFARGKMEAAGYMVGTPMEALANIIIGNKKGRKDLKERRKNRNASINEERKQFGNYKQFNEAKDQEAAERRNRMQNYMHSEETAKNTEEVAENTSKISDDLHTLAVEGTKRGSIYVHDDGVHKYLKDILRHLTGKEPGDYYGGDAPEDAIPDTPLSPNKTQSVSVEKVSGEVVGQESGFFDRTIGWDENGNPVTRREALQNAKSNIKSGISGLFSKVGGFRNERKDGSDDNFANTALQAATVMGMSGDNLGNDEVSIMSSIQDEAGKSKPNKSTISNKLKKMMGLQRTVKEEEKEKKESIWSKLLSGIGSIGSGIGSIIKNILPIAGAVGALYLLFKNGGLKTIGENIGKMWSTDDELKEMGTDSTTLGMNTASAVIDSQVDSKWDWLNPLKSINHNTKDAAGNSIKNSGMTRARNNIFIANALKEATTGTSVRAGMKQFQSNWQMNKAQFYNNRANEATTSLGEKYWTKKMDKSLDRAAALDTEASSFRSTTAGQTVNAAANIAVIGGASKGAGWLAEKVAGKFTNNEETAQKIGNATEGGVSTAFAVSSIKSMATGSTSMSQKIVDGLSKLLSKCLDKIGASKSIGKLLGKAGNSKLVKTLSTLKNDITKAAKSAVTSAGEKLVDAINKKLAECGLGDILTVTTAGLAVAAGAVAGAISGFCGTEHLFGVLNGDADGLMRTISTVIESGMRAAEMVPGIGWIVACFDVIDGFIEGILGCGIKQFIARGLYSLIKGSDVLDEKQAAFDAERTYYNSTFGAEVSSSAFNDMTNSTGFFSRIWSGKAKINEETGHYDYDEDGNIIKSGGIKNGAKSLWKGLTTSPLSMMNHKKNAESENGDASISEESERKVKDASSVLKGSLNGLVSKMADDVRNVASSISGYNKEQYETDENGNPIEYPVDEEGKAISEDGTKYVRKGDIGDLVLSGMKKITGYLISPITQLSKGMDDVDKESPWKKEGSKTPGQWLTKKLGGMWNNIGSAFTALSNVNVTPPSNASSTVAAGGPEASDISNIAGAGAKVAVDVANGKSAVASIAGTGTEIAKNALGEAQGGNPLNKSYKITSPFGQRDYPHPGNHKGVDLVPADGSKTADIGSRFSGTVMTVKSDVPDTDTAEYEGGGWRYKGSNATGNKVAIKTDDGKIVTNMHIKAGSIPSNIKPGAKVKIGDKLGEMGSTGWSTGAHLHYQIEDGQGNYVDPTQTLNGKEFSAFKSSTDKTQEVSEEQASSAIANVSSSSSSDYSYDDGSSTETGSSGSGPLGKLLEMLKSAGNRFLSKLTGGLIGGNYESSSDSSIGTSSNGDANVSVHGGGGASRGSNDNTAPAEGVQLSTTPNSGWVEVVRKVKQAVASQNPIYYTKPGSFTLHIDHNGKDLSVRPDCTGIICAMLKIYGVVESSYNCNSDGFLRDGAIPKGFDKAPWPGWENLIEGDIVVRSGHAEVFAANDGNKHLVYNGGSTDSLRSPGATHTGHKDGYTCIWRCQEEAGASISNMPTPADAVNTGANLVASTANKAINKVDPSGIKDKQGLWNALKAMGYTDTAISGIMGAWEEETHNTPTVLEGDYFLKPDIYDVTSSPDKMNSYATDRLFPGLERSDIHPHKDQYLGSDGKYYPGIGLGQWTGPRSQELLERAKSKGEDWSSYKTQLDFFEDEMERRNLSDVLNTKESPSAAAEYFAKNYEGNSSSKLISARQKQAEALYKQYGSKDSNGATDGNVGMGGDDLPSTIGKSNYMAKPSTPSINTNNSSINFAKSNSVDVKDGTKNAINNLGEGLAGAADTLNTSNVNTGEVVQLLYQVIKLLEGINSNTGATTDVLGSLGKGQGNSQTPKRTTTSHKPSSRLSMTSGNNNRMISSMVRPN